MAEDSDHLADGLDPETAADPAGFLAEENGFDRHVLWRLASWGFGAVGAVTVAILANQSSIGLRHDALASADLARQANQLRSIVGDSQSETRRLSSAVDTLNADRDRLYSRVTVLEQGLDTVTGSISRQIRTPELAQANAAPSSGPEAPAGSPRSGSPIASPSPVKSTDKMPSSQSEPVAQTAPVLSTPPAATSALASKSATEASEPAATKPAEQVSANAPAAPDVIASIAPPGPVSSPTVGNIAVQRTAFAVDVGGASSLEGLRALWRVLIRSNSELKLLQPIVVVKENNTGLGMQLRLIAGPIGDAAAAAKICATLSENNRSCETTVFDGQRLALKGDPPVAMRPSRKRIVRKLQPSPLSFLGR